MFKQILKFFNPFKKKIVDKEEKSEIGNLKRKYIESISKIKIFISKWEQIESDSENFERYKKDTERLFLEIKRKVKNENFYSKKIEKQFYQFEQSLNENTQNRSLKNDFFQRLFSELDNIKNAILTTENNLTTTKSNNLDFDPNKKKAIEFLNKLGKNINNNLNNNYNSLLIFSKDIKKEKFYSKIIELEVNKLVIGFSRNSPISHKEDIIRQISLIKKLIVFGDKNDYSEKVSEIKIDFRRITFAFESILEMISESYGNKSKLYLNGKVLKENVEKTNNYEYFLLNLGKMIKVISIEVEKNDPNNENSHKKSYILRNLKKLYLRIKYSNDLYVDTLGLIKEISIIYPKESQFKRYLIENYKKIFKTRDLSELEKLVYLILKNVKKECVLSYGVLKNLKQSDKIRVEKETKIYEKIQIRENSKILYEKILNSEKGNLPIDNKNI